MQYKYRNRASVYLTPDLYHLVKNEAHAQRVSVSAYIHSIVEAHLQAGGSADADRTLRYLMMAVNALLKYHPAENLLPIVQGTWKDRKKRPGEDDPENADG